MSGKASRDKGSRWERAVAGYLRDALWPTACTTREAFNGTRGDDDICIRQEDGTYIPAPVSIECKDVAVFSPDEWLRQAAASAKGRPYCAIWKQRQKPTAKGWVIYPLPSGGWAMMWLEAWVKLQRSVPWT